MRGENGSGKTTLLNILTGNLEPDVGIIDYLNRGKRRCYRFPRHWWQELNPLDHFAPEYVARAGLGRTWQDVRLFNSQSLRDNVAVAIPHQTGENPVFALFAHRIVRRRESHIRSEADLLLARLGLTQLRDASGDKVSLGQAKRVAIARAVAAGARILFLDEPLAGLDRQGIKDVLSLLELLVSDYSVTLVMVEHVSNQPHLHGLISTDWLLSEGRVYRNERNENHSVPAVCCDATSAALGPSQPAWLSRLVAGDCEVISEQLARGAILTRIRRPDRCHGSPQPALEVRGLVVNRGSRIVVGLDEHGKSSGFDLTLNTGETCILQAPNGWGKSTLLAAIAGLIPCETGTILLGSASLDRLPVWDRVDRGLRFLPSGGSVFSSLRVRDAMKLAAASSISAETCSLSYRLCGSLSGGERQSIGLKGMLAPSKSPFVLMLDEPFSALDDINMQRIIEGLSAASLRSTLIVVPTFPLSQRK